MLPANAICVSPQQQTLQACWEEAHNALYSSYPSSAAMAAASVLGSSVAARAIHGGFGHAAMARQSLGSTADFAARRFLIAR
jgi:hypothetical protein